MQVLNSVIRRRADTGNLMLGGLRQCSRLQEYGMRCCTAFQQQQQQQQHPGSLFDPTLHSQRQLGRTANLKDSIVQPGSGIQVWWTSDQRPDSLPHRWKRSLGTQVASQVPAQHLQAELSRSQQR